MRRLLIAVIVVTLCATMAHGANVDDLVTKADELRVQSTYYPVVPDALNESISLYKQAILADRLDADAWYGLAMAKHKKLIYNNHGEYLVERQEAIGCMERAIELNSTNPKYWEGLGIVSSLVDYRTSLKTYGADYNKSLAAFDRAIELWSDNESKAHDLTGKAFLLTQIGIREGQSTRFYEAIEACDKALRIYPADECAPMFKEDALKELRARNMTFGA